MIIANKAYTLFNKSICHKTFDTINSGRTRKLY